MAGGVNRDQWVYEVRTSSNTCISAINDYYHQVLSYGRQRSVILKATVHDKDCVLANVLVAHFLKSSDPSKGFSHLQVAASQIEQATLYEKSVFDAVKSLISENRDDDVAFKLHLKISQLLCLYMGRPDLSLQLVHQILPQNQEEAYVYGMLAFPLVELGQMEDAEKVARMAFKINKQDCWAQHALCHVLQNECHLKEAVEFMEDCSSSWASCSSFIFNKMSKKKQQLMQRGLSLAEAMYEYGRDNEKRALELLGSDFDALDYKMIGASDEQLDVFNEVWFSMLLNTGQATKAIEVLEKRIKLREGVPLLWRLLERAYNMVGSKEAAIVGQKAKVLETAYF